MKILYFGVNVAFDHHYYSLINGFEKLGHIVIFCNIRGNDAFESILIGAIERYKPDIILSIGNIFLSFKDPPRVWDIVKRYSLPSVYWAIEDPTFFNGVSSLYAKNYNLVLTICEKSLVDYEKLGVKSAYIPHTIDPEIHRKVDKSPEFNSDIVCMANNHGFGSTLNTSNYRYLSFKSIVEPIIIGRYDLKIYGVGWYPNKLGYPSNFFGGRIAVISKIPQAYAGSKISLAVQWDYTGQVCFRTFETLACGSSILISPYTPVQEKLFTHQKHLIYSHSPKETLDYVNFYLNHHTEREKIIAQGREEVYKNHNCMIRAQQAVDAMHKAGVI